jgi:hypothetical protein
VLRELQPLRREEPTPEEDERECRVGIEFALLDIARPPLSPGQGRKKLSRFSSDATRLLNSAGNLPDSARRKLGLSDRYLSETRRMSQVSGNWSDKIVVRRSSGSRAKGDQMLLAAYCAFSLINRYTNKRITLTRGRDYIRIAALMYRMVTGKRGNLEKACSRVFREIRDWPDFEPELPDWERSGEPS